MSNQDCSSASDGLSVKQQAALDAIMGGRRFKYAAAAGGVTLNVLYRWIKSDSAFRADYLLWQELAGEEARTRLVAKAQESVDAVIGTMEADCKFAFKVMKVPGLLKPSAAKVKDGNPVRRGIERAAMDQQQPLNGRPELPEGRNEGNNNGAAAMDEGRSANPGKLSKVRDASSPQENARPAEEGGDPARPLTGPAGNGPQTAAASVWDEKAIASLPPVSGKMWTLEDMSANVPRGEEGSSAIKNGLERGRNCQKYNHHHDRPGTHDNA